MAEKGVAGENGILVENVVRALLVCVVVGATKKNAGGRRLMSESRRKNGNNNIAHSTNERSRRFLTTSPALPCFPMETADDARRDDVLFFVDRYTRRHIRNRVAMNENRTREKKNKTKIERNRKVEAQVTTKER